MQCSLKSHNLQVTLSVVNEKQDICAWCCLSQELMTICHKIHENPKLGTGLDFPAGTETINHTFQHCIEGQALRFVIFLIKGFLWLFQLIFFYLSSIKDIILASDLTDQVH